MTANNEIFYMRLSGTLGLILLGLYFTGIIDTGVGTALNDFLLNNTAKLDNSEYTLGFIADIFNWMWIKGGIPTLNLLTWFLVGLIPLGAFKLKNFFSASNLSAATK